ncbi:HTTM domain-containing protein [Halocynthiibacter styelae]|uniref:HTTM domain-containing protein n=1 Tax=Halocynthiibacter styelae TaxID=2761955 RepID=A0A8J7IHF4_9RHOB|nr:HTTM domain-containing protein [Paenihalocynthiibacter styelae]MBI1492053.1 HTTM domain-containing protein [Paenihalocynthiibacter styelae]
MTFEIALRLTEILLGWAILQASLEHLSLPHMPRMLFSLRATLAVMLILGLNSSFTLTLLLLISILLLHHFQGPYNGGADKMGFLILTCLTLAHLTPPAWAELALAYLAAQLILSYFISGQIKIMNLEWRTGRALSDVFAYSAYPVSENLRALAHKPGLTFTASWAVMLFEVTFPLAFFHATALYLALTIAAFFHLSNACFFGLNRFFWTWLAAYPALIWLQTRLIGA